MAGVRASNTYKNSIFGREICRDLTLSFAPVLSADQDINEARCASTEKAEPGSNADYCVGRKSPRCIDDKIRRRSELLDLAFSSLPSSGGKRTTF
jgi:hypothetical protein